MRRPGHVAVFVALFVTALAATAAVKLLVLDGAHHGAVFGVAYAALGARGAGGILEIVSRAPEGSPAFDDVERSRAAAGRLPGDALSILTVPLAVGASVMLASCTHWAAALELPDASASEVLAQCDLAGVAGSHATLLDPAPLAAALVGVGLTALRPPSQLGTRIAAVAVGMLGVATAAGIGHVLGSGPQPALGACALGAAIVALLRRTQVTSGAIVGALALALAPIVA